MGQTGLCFQWGLGSSTNIDFGFMMQFSIDCVFYKANITGFIVKVKYASISCIADDFCLWIRMCCSKDLY